MRGLTWSRISYVRLLKKYLADAKLMKRFPVDIAQGSYEWDENN